VLVPFHALGVEVASFICQIEPALSVAIWACSLIKAATIPASSAMFIVLTMLVSPGFAFNRAASVGLRVEHFSPN